jgi:hypothetical protein
MTTARSLPADEGPSAHVRNALQLVRLARANLDAVDARLVVALTQLELPTLQTGADNAEDRDG